MGILARVKEWLPLVVAAAFILGGLGFVGYVAFLKLTGR